MGSWSYESFGNDAAGDWIIGLLETPTFEFLQHTLQEYNKARFDDPYPMLEAIAAAEVVSILKGNGPIDYHEDRHGSNHNLNPTLEVLQKQSLPAKLVILAVQVVTAIEISDVFKEYSEEYEEYHNELKGLIARLKPNSHLRAV